MCGKDETSAIKEILSAIRNINVVISSVARTEQLKSFLTQDPSKEKFKVIYDVLSEINTHNSNHISNTDDDKGFKFAKGIRYDVNGALHHVEIRVIYRIIKGKKTISHFYIN